MSGKCEHKGCTPKRRCVCGMMHENCPLKAHLPSALRPVKKSFRQG